MVGINVWWGYVEVVLLCFVEEWYILVLMNGMVCGVVFVDYWLVFLWVWLKVLGEVDVVLIVGVLMDFCLGFGGVFGLIM